MRNIVCLSILLLVIAGCGRKEAPQALANAGPPEIVSLEITDAAPSKKLIIQLAGGEGGVGYHMDRAEIDPYCHCPSMWLRYTEEPARPINNTRKLQKMIRLKVGEHDYIYRFRAVDGAGRLGVWRPIKAFDK